MNMIRFFSMLINQLFWIRAL